MKMIEHKRAVALTRELVDLNSQIEDAALTAKEQFEVLFGDNPRVRLVSKYRKIKALKSKRLDILSKSLKDEVFAIKGKCCGRDVIYAISPGIVKKGTWRSTRLDSPRGNGYSPGGHSTRESMADVIKCVFEETTPLAVLDAEGVDSIYLK